MLVLTRKTGEAIRIAENITIKVVKVQGNRIGIEAPARIAVNRAEVTRWNDVAALPKNREPALA